MNDTSPQPTPPMLEYVFRITATISAPLSGRLAGAGERLHIAITGGSVEGAALAGRIMPGGSDWPRIRPDGSSEIDATYTILTEDGTPILVRNRGLRVSSPAVLARLRAGERVEPSEYYFRSAPVFEAPEGPYQWLNERIFVASLVPQGLAVTIDVYTVH